MEMSTHKLQSVIPHDFQSGVNLDAGRDGGGIIRHIARDVSTASVLISGDYRNLHWYELCKFLRGTKEDNALKLKVRILESLFVFTFLIVVFISDESCRHGCCRR